MSVPTLTAAPHVAPHVAPAASSVEPAAPVSALPMAAASHRLFGRVPTSASAAVAAVAEPAVTLLALAAAHRWHHVPLDRPVMVLGLLVLALSFPGVHRFGRTPLSAAVDVAVSWLWLLLLLLACGVATRSFGYFDGASLRLWAVVTPAAHWLVAVAGGQVVRRRAAQARARRPAVIVGAGALAGQVARVLQARDERPVSVVGCFDDRGSHRFAQPACAVRRLGGLQDLAGYVAAHGVEEVYLTLPVSAQPRIRAVIEALQGTTASIFIVPDVSGFPVIQGRLETVNGLPVIAVCDSPFTGFNAWIKRSMDLLLGTAIVALLAPVMAAIAVGVKLSSPGPVIFRQRRNGLGGEEIVVYKFRSMRAQDDGAVVRQAVVGDPRITPFGAWLRCTSLDELPQFINVLQGRMSIVGPRPHAVAHNETYRQLIQAYAIRHKVRPGITGWAQVHGLRGGTETLEKMRERVEYDLAYLRAWSPALDLQIILRTLRLVVRDRHAY